MIYCFFPGDDEEVTSSLISKHWAEMMGWEGTFCLEMIASPEMIKAVVILWCCFFTTRSALDICIVLVGSSHVWIFLALSPPPLDPPPSKTCKHKEVSH